MEKSSLFKESFTALQYIIENEANNFMLDVLNTQDCAVLDTCYSAMSKKLIKFNIFVICTILMCLGTYLIFEFF